MRTFSSKLNTGMLRPMDIYDIRKHNLVKLIGSQRKGSCAERWGMAPAHLSQILSDKTVKTWAMTWPAESRASKVCLGVGSTHCRQATLGSLRSKPATVNFGSRPGQADACQKRQRHP